MTIKLIAAMICSKCLNKHVQVLSYLKIEDTKPWDDCAIFPSNPSNQCTHGIAIPPIPAAELGIK